MRPCDVLLITQQYIERDNVVSKKDSWASAEVFRSLLTMFNRGSIADLPTCDRLKSFLVQSTLTSHKCPLKERLPGSCCVISTCTIQMLNLKLPESAPFLVVRWRSQ